VSEFIYSEHIIINRHIRAHGCYNLPIIIHCYSHPACVAPFTNLSISRRLWCLSPAIYRLSCLTLINLTLPSDIPPDPFSFPMLHTEHHCWDSLGTWLNIELSMLLFFFFFAICRLPLPTLCWIQLFLRRRTGQSVVYLVATYLSFVCSK
jgi:hypothetical protein